MIRDLVYAAGFVTAWATNRQEMPLGVSIAHVLTTGGTAIAILVALNLWL